MAPATASVVITIKFLPWLRVSEAKSGDTIYELLPSATNTTVSPFTAVAGVSVSSAISTLAAVNVPVDSEQEMRILFLDSNKDSPTITTIRPVGTVAAAVGTFVSKGCHTGQDATETYSPPRSPGPPL